MMKKIYLGGLAACLLLLVACGGAAPTTTDTDDGVTWSVTCDVSNNVLVYTNAGGAIAVVKGCSS